VQARRAFGRKFFREILIMACWALWKHRNEVIFDAVNLSLARWKFIFKEELRLVLFRARPSLKQSWNFGYVISISVFTFFWLDL
jgi:hypothetical protein